MLCSAVNGLLDQLQEAFMAELWGVKTRPLLLGEVEKVAMGLNMKQ